MTVKYRAYLLVILCVNICIMLMWNFSKTGHMLTSFSSSLHLSSNHSLASQESSTSNSNLESYFVYTKGCVIPRRDAFNDAVLKYYSKPSPTKNCHANVPLTSQDGTMLYLDNKTISYCEYQNIYRKPHNDFNFLVKEKYNFTDNVNISSKYIRVICYDKSGKKNYTNYHHFIQRNESRVLELDQKLNRHISENKPAEVMNVIMIMIDSTSRLNHIRQMPKTRQFLLKNLATIDLEGYNKVGANTFPNIVPILTGNYVAEEFTISKTPYKGPYDKFNLIWKHFSSNGYTTMFSEDWPRIGAFSYLSKGFIKQPCDHSIRPLAFAISQYPMGAKCHGNRSDSEVFLESIYNFVNTYRDKPHFSLTTLSQLTHDYLNKLGNADDYYLDFFTRLHRENLLNNTITVFFSDHGQHITSIIRSEIGQFEARMPMMYFAFPMWFKEKYPAIYKNLLENRNKLTSNFDINKTLQDILYFTGKPRANVDVNVRAQSLFDHISGERTCQTANISIHWCVCKMDEIPQDKSLLHTSVEFAMREINNIIQNYSMCMPRTLQHVESFKRLKYRNQVNLTVTYIKTSFVSTPDSAKFQATIQYNEITKQFKVMESITRISKYGRTADCVKQKFLRNYCYCTI